MSHDAPAYGLWTVAILNAAVFIMFAFSFSKPRTERDWRSFGAFSAFIIALFAEMYGFPLTIYLLAGWLGSRYPGLDPFSHDAGHLWSTLLGLQGNPHLSVLHLLSNLLIFGGFVLISLAWERLHGAQRTGALATTGPYQRVEEVGFQSCGSVATLTTSIAASRPVATMRIAVWVSAAVRTSRRAETRTRNSRGVPAPTRSRMIRPRL